MAGAFLYLFACTLRNRLRVRFRRLRQPRYLIGLFVGLGYLYLVLASGPSGRRERMPPGVLAALERIAAPLQFVGAVLLFVITAASWVAPGAGRPLEFSRAEVQFLFQAPVTRRQLLHYKLLRGQIGVLAGSAIATIFLRPASFAAGWTFMIGMWILFATLRLHLIGIALRRQSLARHGRSGIARQWLPVLVVATAAVILGGTVAADWERLAAMTRPSAVLGELQRLGGQGAARWVLWPFRAVIALPLSGTPAAFFQALPPALLLLVLNYLWVLRGDRAFEEASAADAERRAAERAAPRPVRRPSKAMPFALALTGRPETAIFWKNLILLGRYATSRSLLRLVPVVIAVAIAFGGSRGRQGLTSFAASISLLAAAMTVLVGPQAVRNDFRQDLASLAVLKTWPVRGAAIVRGELLAPIVALSVMTWLLVAVGAILLPAGRAPAVGPWPAGALPPAVVAAAAALAAPGLIGAQLVLHNAIALLFPAWVAVGPSRPRGIDALGQRLLMTAGILLVLMLALIPGLAAAAVAGIALYFVAPALAALQLVVAAAAAGVVMIGECWLAALWLGGVFDRMDVGAVEAIEN